jgi:prepilin-type N-terminal cleavage/methylation domain-containing protein/prepilin-type processing-associated H-X9-DG protein
MRHRQHTFPRKPGRAAAQAFSLVELLIVIAIIGILMALLIPAVQFARESARRTHCENNLHQLSLAFQLHHDSQQHLPTGGWGWGYVGEPDKGYGRQQPGGWPYNILEQIEQGNVRSNPIGMIERPIGTFHCPSLRRAVPYPITLQPVNVPPAPMGAKIDYAACAGADRDEVGQGGPFERPVDLGGIIGVKSMVRFADVTDGLSNTLMLAEKFVHPLDRDSGTCPADNENLYTGLNNDHSRSTKHAPQTLRGNQGYPVTFGSYHAGAFNAAYCDGSVRQIAYGVERGVFLASGTRDRQEVNLAGGTVGEGQ